MPTHNDITGDALVSRPTLSKEGQKNWDNIFSKKKTNGGWKPPLKPLAPEPVQLELDFGDEHRIDIIGQNGNTGEHYE